ncbi:MAG TPA: TlyA family RNA methyltransferase [Pseudogracilibacillus sp.]|nr:TlyA family RNA methyltransferase [Pseudogracilibacillus sp.]
MTKERLDVLLVQKELAETREKAKRLIMAGVVFSGPERLDKPGVKIDSSIPLHVKGKLPYVSRGGYKLEKALQVFNFHVKNKTVLDIGASTGGFTDCALQYGAEYVYAIDVGHNQLVWKLRNDPQVEVHERTNFRYVTPDLFASGTPNVSVTDVSFISLRLIFPVLKTLLQPESDIIVLVKPQFEAEKNQVGKKGVVKDSSVHISVLREIISFAIDEGFTFLGLDYSPITGGEGNIEFIGHFGWEKQQEDERSLEVITEVVESAHHHFQAKRRGGKNE